MIFTLSIIFCANGETSAYISMDNEFLPVDNCSKAYMEILHSEFGCAKGSLQYCSRGYYDWPDDITGVKFSKTDSSSLTKISFLIFKFKEDCFQGDTVLETGWYRKACTSPIWKKLNEECHVFEWDVKHLGKEKTRACSGDWGGEHYFERDACNGAYNCADRSDEAGCDEIKENSVSIDSFANQFEPSFYCG